MAFPTVNYKYNNVEGAESFAGVMDKKLESLGRFIKDGVTAICDVEFEKVAEQKNGKIHRVEVTLTIDGILYRAEATEETFEQAIDEVRNELDKEIRRAKDKHDSLLKRAGRRMKELFRN